MGQVIMAWAQSEPCCLNSSSTRSLCWHLHICTSWCAALLCGCTEVILPSLPPDSFLHCLFHLCKVGGILCLLCLPLSQVEMAVRGVKQSGAGGKDMKNSLWERYFSSQNLLLASSVVSGVWLRTCQKNIPTGSIICVCTVPSTVEW